MSKDSTKPGDENDTGTGSGPTTGAPAPATAVESNAAAIRAATTQDESSSSTPSIPDLLDRVADIEAQLASLLDDLAVAIPDLRAPAPIPSRLPSTSGAFAPMPAVPTLETLRVQAASGDRSALMRYLRLRRS